MAEVFRVRKKHSQHFKQHQLIYYTKDLPMDSSFNVTDPSDWIETPLSHLAPVEQALRCQVCKDFFDTPMITSCSHTFCSLCIRRCLTNDGRCPMCRANDQEMKLRSNAIIQELVDLFQTARPGVLQLGQEVKATRDGLVRRAKKRKLEDMDVEDDEKVDKPYNGRRKTRSQQQSNPSVVELSMDQAMRDEKDIDFEPDDGLAACPICRARMKEEAVFTHLDIHNKPGPVSQDQAEQSRKSPSFNMVSRSRQPPKPMERLPQLNYSLLKDNALRKKMSELGLPNSGPRALLIRRHTEWINLVNANCDSRRPRTKRELLHELDVWDKTQGRQVCNSSNGVGGSSSVMDKDFDGAAWATSHDSDFQSLIARARRKTKPETEDTGTADQSNVPAPEHSIGNELLPNHNLLASKNTDDPDRAPQAQEDNMASPPSNLSLEVAFVDLEAEG